MRRTLSITSEPANLCTVRRLVGDFALACDIHAAEVELVVLGLDEACSNVIRHAYQCEPGWHIHLVCEKLSDQLRFRLRDFGKPCDPSMFNAKLKERPLDCLRPGGLGLHFIRKAFDEIHFIPKEMGTELVLIKRFKGKEQARLTIFDSSDSSDCKQAPTDQSSETPL